MIGRKGREEGRGKNWEIFRRERERERTNIKIGSRRRLFVDAGAYLRDSFSGNAPTGACLPNAKPKGDAANFPSVC